MDRIPKAIVVIAANNLLTALGFRVWQAIFNNYAVEELGAQASHIGLIQAVREVPGALGFLVGALALVFAEMRIAGFSVVLLGVGVFLTAYARSFAGAIGITLVMSAGFHFFFSSNASAVLITVGPRRAASTLGKLNSLGALAAVLATLFILAALGTWGYRPILQVAGAVTAIGGLVLLPFARQPVRVQRTRTRTPLRRRYWRYYALEFLMGSRRHMFSTFAVFLLVREYKVTAQTITLLFLINSLMGVYLHQALGRIVTRLGERRILTFNFSVLMLVFTGYAIVPLVSTLDTSTFLVPAVTLGEWTLFPAFPATPGLLVLLGLFMVDQVLNGLSFALKSYFQKIVVAAEEITPNVSLGQTFNHIAAVLLPIGGGLIWEAVGAQYTFLAGVAIATVSLFLTIRMRVPRHSFDEAPALSAVR
jgi:MFS family permease